MNYGYVRVSTKEQNVDRQINAIKDAAGKDVEVKLFVEKVSGKNFERQEYKRMLRQLKAGDTIFVKSVDRFGRNYEEIIAQWKEITTLKQADIVVLDVPLLDTRNTNDLTGKVISDLFLQLLSYFAQAERETLRQRQREGIDIAKKKGVQFGRRAKLSKEKFLVLYKGIETGKYDVFTLCKDYGISKGTYRNYVQKYIKNEQRDEK